MKIDKDKLFKEYTTGNYDDFFRDAAEITDFLLVRKYYSLEEEERKDLLQDCMVSLWEKHLSNKIDVTKCDNLMSFIWQNSSYKILDYLKKQKRRNNIIYFFSYEECLTESECLKKQNGEVDGDYDY